MVGCDPPFILDELGEVLEILTVCVSTVHTHRKKGTV